MLRHSEDIDRSCKSLVLGNAVPAVQHDGTGLAGHQHNVIDGMLIAALASLICWALALALIV